MTNAIRSDDPLPSQQHCADNCYETFALDVVWRVLSRHTSIRQREQHCDEVRFAKTAALCLLSDSFLRFRMRMDSVTRSLELYTPMSVCAILYLCAGLFGSLKVGLGNC